jgi:hypothetical protein
MNYSNEALSVFITIQGINIGGLITDYVLIKNNLPSISQVSINYPVVGIALILIELMSPISIGIHLYFFNRSRV